MVQSQSQNIYCLSCSCTNLSLGLARDGPSLQSPPPVPEQPFDAKVIERRRREGQKASGCTILTPRPPYWPQTSCSFAPRSSPSFPFSLTALRILARTPLPHPSPRRLAHSHTHTLLSPFLTHPRPRSPLLSTRATRPPYRRPRPPPVSSWATEISRGHSSVSKLLHRKQNIPVTRRPGPASESAFR